MYLISAIFTFVSSVIIVIAYVIFRKNNKIKSPGYLLASSFLMLSLAIFSLLFHMQEKYGFLSRYIIFIRIGSWLPLILYLLFFIKNMI